MPASLQPIGSEAFFAEEYMGHAEPRVALVQDGARGHYGLALALQRAGILEVVFTDFFVRRGRLLDRASHVIDRFGPRTARRMFDRQCPELDGARVRTHLLRRVWQEFRSRHFRDSYQYFRWQARDNGKWIQSRLPPSVNILMGFVRNLDPRLCEVAASRGIQCVGDQMIAPGITERDEARIAHERFPGWEAASPTALDTLIEMESETWDVLTAISCPSEYVKNELVKAGVAKEKIHVINYPVDENAFHYVDRRGRKAPLKVGFVGQVGLRKGVPYFSQVASRFSPNEVQFYLVGHSLLTPEAARNVAAHATITSALRSEVPRYLAEFDLIYFPTTCEGSAYALMEAMATGLPVVTSPNSGTVARHGIEGFLCPYDDIDAATEYIHMLVRDEELRLNMGRAARARYLQFGMSNYSACLAAMCRDLLSPSSLPVSS
jgi:glycosyltransferase involved in cell wall biosynthesis